MDHQDIGFVPEFHPFFDKSEELFVKVGGFDESIVEGIEIRKVKAIIYQVKVTNNLIEIGCK